MYNKSNGNNLIEFTECQKNYKINKIRQRMEYKNVNVSLMNLLDSSSFEI